MGFTGLSLGSWWAVMPAVPAIAWFLRRTLIEDAMLRSELGGYDAYAGRVRFRLVPGLW
jgi:protein-S-isoprenylcysteine O-methyltransferase Ste14